MTILIMDAQGGGVGRQLVEQMKKALPDQPLLAVGASAAATVAMLKAGADQGATGENAVRVNCARADLILCPIGMALCDGMLGEVTQDMAAAVGRSPAYKIFIPASRCGVRVAGCPDRPVSESVALAVQEAVKYLKQP